MPNIELTIARSHEMKKLRKDFDEVTNQLESRKIIEKAKGKIMIKSGLSEQDSYNYIRDLSKKKDISMKRVAEIILIQSGE
jgi:AmiR/NasT family two-component response regulator